MAKGTMKPGKEVRKPKKDAKAAAPTGGAKPLAAPVPATKSKAK